MSYSVTRTEDQSAPPELHRSTSLVVGFAESAARQLRHQVIAVRQHAGAQLLNERGSRGPRRQHVVHFAGYGAGGGGWSGNGVADGSNGEGGFAFLAASPNAGRGGRGLKCDGPPYADGGFGGGGAGNGCNGAGGGGGYSGGGGGRIGGGGGSWNSGANPHASVQCLPEGHGKVVIEWLRP